MKTPVLCAGAAAGAPLPDSQGRCDGLHRGADAAAAAAAVLLPAPHCSGCGGAGAQDVSRPHRQVGHQRRTECSGEGQEELQPSAARGEGAATAQGGSGFFFLSFCFCYWLGSEVAEYELCFLGDQFYVLQLHSFTCIAIVFTVSTCKIEDFDSYEETELFTYINVWLVSVAETSANVVSDC